MSFPLLKQLLNTEHELLSHPAGLRIISNLDEVAFVQNLVFYIEAAYKVAVGNIFRGLDWVCGVWSVTYE